MGNNPKCQDRRADPTAAHCNTTLRPVNLDGFYCYSDIFAGEWAVRSGVVGRKSPVERVVFHAFAEMYVDTVVLGASRYRAGLPVG